MSKIKVNEIEKASGSGITVPTGTSFTITDGLAVSSLPTVTVAKGGTGLTSLGSAGQSLKVNSSGNALEYGTVAGYTDNDVKTLLTGASSYPVFACRGWANITGGSGSLRASGNCSSITDLGTGHYRFNFTTALNDVNYVVCGESAENWNSSNDYHNDHNNFAIRRKIFTTSSFEVESRNSSNTNTDHEAVFVAAFR